MADNPISLGKARKAKARAEARAQADENAVTFGRTKAQKARDKEEAARRARLLDGKKRDDS